MLLSMMISPLSLPHMTFRYVSYTVPDPHQTAEYVLKYVGGASLHRDQMLAFKSMDCNVSGIRFAFANRSPNPRKYFAYFDIYFWSNFKLPYAHLAVNTAVNIDTHLSMAPNLWSFWDDRHLCVIVDDIDPVALRLARDQRPMFSIFSGIYFHLPGGLTMQVQSETKLCSFLTPIVWDFCEDTREVRRPYSLTNFTPYENLPTLSLPTMVFPGHHAFATSDADASRDWMTRLFPLEDVGLDYAYLYKFGNGSCANVRWATLDDNDFKLHFVTQLHKRQGKKRVAEHELDLRRIRKATKLVESDAFFGSRIGFSTDSLAPFLIRLDEEKQVYSYDGDRLLVHAPWGFLIELVVLPSDEQFDARAYGPPDTCYKCTGNAELLGPLLAVMQNAYVLNLIRDAFTRSARMVVHNSAVDTILPDASYTNLPSATLWLAALIPLIYTWKSVLVSFFRRQNVLH